MALSVTSAVQFSTSSPSQGNYPQMTRMMPQKCRAQGLRTRSFGNRRRSCLMQISIFDDEEYVGDQGGGVLRKAGYAVQTEGHISEALSLRPADL
jgi:hypothetical protein